MILENQGKDKKLSFSCQIRLFSWNEYSVAIVFLIMIILWLTKQFGDTPGWELLFREEYLK
jgi:hypothetical protein